MDHTDHPARQSRAAQRAATIRRILQAAGYEFGHHGEAATIRAVATRAGVDPSLVIHYFGSKKALFAAVTTSGATETHLRDVISAKLAEPAPEALALIRSMFDDPASAELIRTFLNDRVTNLAHDRSTQAQLAAAMTVSALFGLTITRQILELDVFVDASDDQITQAAQRFLGIAEQNKTSRH